jgi:hypothetical protein
VHLRYLDRLCRLVVRVRDYRSRGPGSTAGATNFIWVVVGLERGPLSLVNTIEELLLKKSIGTDQKIDNTAAGDPPRRLSDTPYPQKGGINFSHKQRSLGRYSLFVD